MNVTEIDKNERETMAEYLMKAEGIANEILEWVTKVMNANQEYL